MRLFHDLVPTRYIWVSVDGSDRNTGSKDAPMASIQAAVDAASPGTAVLVEAGTYHENVKVRSNGTEDAPIWIVSADGYKGANVVPLSDTLSTIYGRGVDNVVISGFAIEGAKERHAVEFTQSGRDYSNWGNNLVIENNYINNKGFDGIKISQTNTAEVVGNTVIGGSEESIDFVTVFDAVIAGNEIEGLDGRSGITVKAGSERVVIANNSIKNVGVDGINVGGWTNKSINDDLSLEFQARHIVVKENFIQDIEKRPINIHAGQDSIITNNYLDPQNSYFTTVHVQNGRWGLDSKNITIEDNIITREKWLSVSEGQGEGLSVSNNRQSGSMDFDVGRTAQDKASLTWLHELRIADPEPSAPLPTSDSDLVTTWQIDRMFNGVDDRQVIEHGAAWSLANGTISFSFNAHKLEGVQGLMSKDAMSFGDGGHLSLWLEDDQLVARFQGTDASYVLKTDPGSIAANAETHVAMTFGDGGVKLYVDGNLAGANGFNGTLIENQEPIVLGGRAVFSSEQSADVVTNFFKGTIGQINLHTTALNEQEIGALAGVVALPHSPEPAADPEPSAPLPTSDSDLVTTWQIDRMFNGVDDRQVIEHGAAWSLANGTISFSFNAHKLEGVQGLMSKDAMSFGDGGHLSLWLEDDQLVARFQGTDASYVLKTDPGSIAANAETHVAMTFGDGGVKLYVDGNLAGANGFNGTLIENQEPIVLGGRAVFSSEQSADVVTNFFKGTIGQINLHTTALNEQEIGALAGVVALPHSPEPAANPEPSAPLPTSDSDLVTTWQIDRMFDGVNDRQVIEHGANLEISDGAISVTFTPSNTNGMQGLVSKDAKYFGDGGHFTLYLEDNKLVGRLQGKDESYIVESHPRSIQAGKETTATVEFGTQGMRLILDGNVVDRHSYSGGIEQNDEPLLVGASAIYSSEGQTDALRHFFDGRIHEVSATDRKVAFLTSDVDDAFVLRDDPFSNNSFDAFDS